MTPTKFGNASRTIDARPAPIEVDLSRAALIIVDMQNDFGSKGGMFDRMGIDISPIRAAMGPISQVAAICRTCRVPIVYIKMGYLADLSDLGDTGAPNRERHLLFGVGEEVKSPAGQDSRILIRNTWNTDIVDELAPEADDLVLYKHRYSAFYETGLDWTQL